MSNIEQIEKNQKILSENRSLDPRDQIFLSRIAGALEQLQMADQFPFFNSTIENPEVQKSHEPEVQAFPQKKVPEDPVASEVNQESGFSENQDKPEDRDSDKEKDSEDEVDLDAPLFNEYGDFIAPGKKEAEEKKTEPQPEDFKSSSLPKDSEESKQPMVGIAKNEPESTDIKKKDDIERTDPDEKWNPDTDKISEKKIEKISFAVKQEPEMPEVKADPEPKKKTVAVSEEKQSNSVEASETVFSSNFGNKFKLDDNTVSFEGRTKTTKFHNFSFGAKKEKEEKPEKPKKEEPVINSPLFRINPFQKSKEEKKDDEKENERKPKFTAEVTSDDPDQIMEKLREKRKAYEERKQVVIDLSTGSQRNGNLDAKEISDRIGKVAEGLVQTSRNDRLLNTKIQEGQKSSLKKYHIQEDTDLKRRRDQFILDVYSLQIHVLGEDEEKEEQASLIVAPITIPESGSKLVTDICACLDSGEEASGAAVLPGGKTTVTIRCEDYIVLVKGYWEKGQFYSSASVMGNGSKVECEMEKIEIRPESMDEIGIGHNVLYLDHATTVHFIPTNMENNAYGLADFMGIVIKDYGIESDAECLISDKDISVKGERYRYTIHCHWNEKDEFCVEPKTEKR